ncbi:YqzH family protein [Neobacillus dielmonensis]|uniref:YqzH family protein n=1 Tax=Neobacillus dielmonensis TaxID=1347369 RepID=UPI0005A8966B|nr:YqzH family protein [Neobacillus dielmonensis]
MEEKLIVKMILNCFSQYGDTDSAPIGEQELNELVRQIVQTKQQNPNTDLYEVINDKVYEFLTG